MNNRTTQRTALVLIWLVLGTGTGLHFLGVDQAPQTTTTCVGTTEC